MPSKRRVHMVAEKIRMLVSEHMNRLADPRLELVTITSVMVSPDLRYAKIYWVASGGSERRAEVEEGFQSAEGTFKRLLGKELGVRFVPDIRFFYDDTLDTQEEVARLFQRIQQK